MHDTFCNLQKCTQIERQLQKPRMRGSSSSTRPTRNQGRTSSSRRQRPCQPREGLLRAGGQGASRSEPQGGGGHPLVGDRTVLTGHLSPEEFLSACGWWGSGQKALTLSGWGGMGRGGKGHWGESVPRGLGTIALQAKRSLCFRAECVPSVLAPRRRRTPLPPLTDVPSIPCRSAHRAPAPECQHLLSAHGIL